MFRGINGVNMDIKGRLMMPVRYREELTQEARGTIVLTIDTEEKCLLLYPLPAWEEIESKLAILPSFNPAARRIQRLLIGHATDVELDGQGRVLVPPMLRDYAGLSRQAVLVGQGNKFELWDEKHWSARRNQWIDEDDSDLEKLPEELKQISL